MPINRYILRSTFVGALGGLLFGFDTAVISGATKGLIQSFGLVIFQLFIPLIHKSVAVSELGITVSIALWGTVIGALTAGYLGQRYGSREMLRLTAILCLVSSIGCAVAPARSLQRGRFCCAHDFSVDWALAGLRYWAPSISQSSLLHAFEEDWSARFRSIS